MGIEELNRLIACAELRNPNQFNASRERYIAEISFKAGEQIGIAKGVILKTRDITLLNKEEMEELNAQAKDFYNKAEQAGIREVVEWMKSQPKLYWTEEWQAKLKEWGY